MLAESVVEDIVAALALLIVEYPAIGNEKLNVNANNRDICLIVLFKAIRSSFLFITLTMALDPQSKLILDQLGTMKMPPLEALKPEQLRMANIASNSGEQEAVGKIENRTIPGPGGEIPVRVYYPKESQASYPGLVFFHGGGWVIGDIDSHDDICRSLTNLANCVIISVDYRLTPENKFPAGVEDAYASAQYVYEHYNIFLTK